MEELLAEISAKTGVGPEPARKAVAIIVNHLNRNAPPEKMARLFAAIPGTEGLVEEKRKRGLGAIFGNTLIGVWSDLKATGLSEKEMKAAGEELLAHAEARMGKDEVRSLLASVPGLKAYL